MIVIFSPGQLSLGGIEGGIEDTRISRLSSFESGFGNGELVGRRGEPEGIGGEDAGLPEGLECGFGLAPRRGMDGDLCASDSNIDMGVAALPASHGPVQALIAGPCDCDTLPLWRHRMEA